MIRYNDIMTGSLILENNFMKINDNKKPMLIFYRIKFVGCILIFTQMFPLSVKENLNESVPRTWNFMAKLEIN